MSQCWCSPLRQTKGCQRRCPSSSMWLRYPSNSNKVTSWSGWGMLWDRAMWPPASMAAVPLVTAPVDSWFWATDQYWLRMTLSRSSWRFFFFFQFCGSGRSPILDKQLTKALTDISKLMLCLQGCVCTPQEYPVTAESGLGTWIPWNWLQTAVSNLSVGAATWTQVLCKSSICP